MQCSTSWLMSYRNRRCLLTHVNPNVKRGLLRATVRVKNIKTGKVGEKNILKRHMKPESKKTLVENLTEEEDVKSNEHNRCLRCGKKLKNPEYRLLGYGPVCYEKLQTPNIKKLF